MCCVCEWAGFGCGRVCCMHVCMHIIDLTSNDAHLDSVPHRTSSHYGLDIFCLQIHSSATFLFVTLTHRICLMCPLLKFSAIPCSNPWCNHTLEHLWTTRCSHGQPPIKNRNEFSTHLVVPFVNFTSGSKSVPSGSGSGLMSNVASIYATAVHNIASATCSPGQTRRPKPKEMRVGSSSPSGSSVILPVDAFRRNLLGLNVSGEEYRDSS